MMFQSLIGKLTTRGLTPAPEDLRVFQSLIGKLTTLTGVKVRERLDMFQSLIGKLTTGNLKVAMAEGSCFNPL